MITMFLDSGELLATKNDIQKIHLATFLVMWGSGDGDGLFYCVILVILLPHKYPLPIIFYMDWLSRIDN